MKHAVEEIKVQFLTVSPSKIKKSAIVGNTPPRREISALRVSIVIFTTFGLEFRGTMLALVNPNKVNDLLIN
jgi:hypothetical protein